MQMKRLGVGMILQLKTTTRKQQLENGMEDSMRIIHRESNEKKTQIVF